MNRAACRGAAFNSKNSYSEFDPFFPEKGQPRGEGQSRYCINCPVISECKQYSNEVGARHGIWGGNYHSDPDTEAQ